MAKRLSACRGAGAALCAAWRARAAEQGWSFPSDWYVPAVAEICEAIATDHDIWAAAEQLGRSRAAAGVPLAEALVDVDGLATIAHRRYTDPLRRAVSLGWADRITAPPTTVADPLTGLVTPEYLRVRLGEVYRAAAARRDRAGDGGALVVVRLDLTGQTEWGRTLPMILVADSLRHVFDAGQSLAVLRESIAVALCDADPVLPRRALLLPALIGAAIDSDPQLTVPRPSVWIEALPPTYQGALDLLDELGR